MEDSTYISPVPVQTGTTDITHEKFAEMQREISQYWPCAKYLPVNKKTLSMFEYANSLPRKNPHQETESRRDEFRSSFKNYVEKLLGPDVAYSAYTQLATNHSISTAQHYNPLSHPKSVNPTLQTALAYVGRQELDRQNIIVLACAGISFDNPWFPRGHYFHVPTATDITELQIPFFGRAVDSEPVVFAPAYIKDTAKNIEKRLKHYQSERVLKKREFKKVNQLLTEVMFHPDVLQQQLYIDQLTIQNFHLWKKMFAHVTENVPNLIFMSQEKVALDIIKEHHLSSDTLIKKILLDPTYHQLIIKYFNNILCAFSTEREYGTFLFWGLPKNSKYRVRLMPHGNKLTSPDGSFSVELTAEGFRNAIENNELIPSVLLTFIVLSLYYGYFISGGLDQPWYLSEAKEAYIKMLTELHMDQEIEAMNHVVTNDSVITRASLAFLQGPNDTRIPASGLDLVLYGNKEMWPTMVTSSQNTMYDEFTYRIYPELYRDYCEHEKKNPDLLTITERQIESFTGIDKKVPAFTTLEATE